MILIVDMNQKKDSLALAEFVLPIASIVGGTAGYEVRHHTEVDRETADRYEKVILSGTPLKDNAYMDHIEGFGWIRDAGIPVLGICAGMQVIGMVFGSFLVECREIGMTRIETTGENPFFSGTFEAYELHSYSVEPSGDFEVIARSENCVQGIKHKGREVYGLLFHPEVRNKEIVERFVRAKRGR
jgi:GMP synthase (glutamine-hydrolysing)